ncbi:hypothetical protein [Celeribacter sp. ULVN23_4]
MRKFISRTGSLPPREVYKLHPAFEQLCDVLIDRRASWDGAYEDEALAILRSFFHDGEHQYCLGGTAADHIRDRDEALAQWRQNPQGRPSKWRENYRLRTYLAELLDYDREPEDEMEWDVWRQISHANYVPHVLDLTCEATWR